MKFSDAFKETMFRFKLTGAELSHRSGVTRGQISQFRNGKNLRIDSVERIIEALPQEAKIYMLFLVAGDEQPDSMPLPNRPHVEPADEEN